MSDYYAWLYEDMDNTRSLAEAQAAESSPAADAAAMTTARQIVSDALCVAINDWSIKHMHLTAVVQGTTEAVFAALAEKGLVIVERDDLELAVEWMDQADNPWSGEAFQETWVDSLLMRDRLKDALAASYAARQGDSDDR